MIKSWCAFLVAIQFFTRIPLKLNEKTHQLGSANASLAFPAVGLIIGSVLVFVASILSNVDSLLSSAILLAIWVAITGGLHLDGLADSVDALIGGHGDKEKSLAIMKDPASGPIAVVVLLVVLLLKFCALNVLLTQQAYEAILLAPIVARAFSLHLLCFTAYAREQGIATPFQMPNKNWTYLVLIITTLLTLNVGVVPAITGLLVCVVMYFWIRHTSQKIIDGYTGDVAGALIEIVEMCWLIAIVMFLSIAI